MDTDISLFFYTSRILDFYLTISYMLLPDITYDLCLVTSCQAAEGFCRRYCVSLDSLYKKVDGKSI